MNHPAVRHYRWRLCLLFFLQAHAQALWYVPFSNILRAHGLDWLTPFAFAVAAVAALVSPIIGGVLADEHVPAERLLGWLMICVSILLGMVFLAIHRGWNGGWVLLLLLAQQLASAPTGSLIVAIILATLRNPEREYGPVRVWATIGWMVAAPLLSFYSKADTSTLSGFLAAGTFLVVAIYAFTLPETPPAASPGPRRWRDLLGRDTVALLHDHDVRVVMITAALFSMPLAAYYPFTPLFLRDSGSTHATLLMSLGQATEVFGAFLLAPLLTRYRLKGILMTGLCLGVARYALYAVGVKAWVLTGIALHGFSYMLYFVSAQLYLERRIEARFRGRAQALLVLMMLGVGNLFGSLLCGWLRHWCRTPEGTQWALYWAILAGWTAAVLIYFLLRFREPAPVRLDLPEGELPANALPGE
jgi:nucleoside transporter